MAGRSNRWKQLALCGFALFWVSEKTLADSEDYCPILHHCEVPEIFKGGTFAFEPIVAEISFRLLQKQCDVNDGDPLSGALGCTIFAAGVCHIFLASEIRLLLPELFDLARDHELAHCRGWRHN